jgi:hypothetical protein
MIVFGWNSFKVRSFTLSDLGIMKQEEAGLQFEVRQAYFHLFWIPFFGLGKRWVVRRGGKMYEIPDEIKHLAQRSLTGVKTPWYTCAGPVLMIAGLIIFSIVTSIEERQRHKEYVNEFNGNTAELASKLQHLTTNDFITVVNGEHPYSNETLFLKVEEIKGDDILVTAVESKSEAPMEVEGEYTKHSTTMPSFKTSYKKLLTAFPKVYDSIEGAARYRQGAKLLNDSVNYVVKDVVRHFRPIVKVSYANYYDHGISIYCKNEGWPATITEMKNVIGNIDWTEIINTEFPGESSSSSNTLDGKNCTYGQPYKFVMTLKDSTGHLHKYELEGAGNNSITIHAL